MLTCLPAGARQRNRTGAAAAAAGGDACRGERRPQGMLSEMAGAVGSTDVVSFQNALKFLIGLHAGESADLKVRSCCTKLTLCSSGGACARRAGMARGRCRLAAESSELKSAQAGMLAGFSLVRSACFIRQLACCSKQCFLQTRSACHTRPSPLLAGPAAPDRRAQAQRRAGHFHGA